VHHSTQSACFEGTLHSQIPVELHHITVSPCDAIHAVTPSRSILATAQPECEPRVCNVKSSSKCTDATQMPIPRLDLTSKLIITAQRLVAVSISPRVLVFEMKTTQKRVVSPIISAPWKTWQNQYFFWQACYHAMLQKGLQPRTRLPETASSKPLYLPEHAAW
jgi:hypothetical protein